MAGTVEGGRKARDANLASDPDFYRRIGAIGGRNGKTGGFAKMTPCYCPVIKGSHHKAQCAGMKGGLKSRRGKPAPIAGGVT